MHPLPHRYTVQATGGASGDVRLLTGDVPALDTAPPPEFDGPGDRWSPETLLIGAVADCFVLTFRAVARAAKLDWSSLSVSVEGVLDKADGVMRFTHLTVRPTLSIAPDQDAAKATRLLEKAERHCLISNSLSAEKHLEPTVTVG